MIQKYKLPVQSLVGVYAFLMLETKWSTLSLLTNLTPKSSTTRPKVMGLDSWCHRPGVLVLSLYPKDVSLWQRLCWQGYLSMVSPALPVSSWCTPNHLMPVCQDCIVQLSTWETKTGGSSCTWNTQALPRGKIFWCWGTCTLHSPCSPHYSNVILLYPGLRFIWKHCHCSWLSYLPLWFKCRGDCPFAGGNQRLDLRR